MSQSIDLTILRALAEQLRFESLNQQLETLWQTEQTPSLLPLLALAKFQLNDFKQASDFFDLAMEAKPNLNLDEIVDLAGCAISMQKIALAITLLDEVLQKAPNHAIALARKGVCFTRLDQYDQARALLEMAVTLNPKRFATFNALIRLLILQKDTFQAKQRIQQAQALIGSQKELTKETYEAFGHLLKGLQLELWVVTQAFSEIENWLDELTVAFRAELKQSDDLNDDQLEKLALWVFWLNRYAQLLAEQNAHEQAISVLREGLKEIASLEESLPLKLLLVELAKIQGQTFYAYRILKNAINQKPESLDLWIQLGHLMLEVNSKESKDAFAKAQALKEQQVSDAIIEGQQVQIYELKLNNLSALLASHDQKFDQAEQLFLTCLKENPDYLPALRGLGQLKMQCGAIEEAIELFERLKSLDPVMGYSALINARQFPEDEAVLTKIEKVAQKPSLEGTLKSGLYFQLAAAWEKRKVYDKAIAFAKSANSASRRLLNYNAKEHRNRCGQIRSVFGPELYQHRPNYGVGSTLPVFVVGMPRSGTTLVEQILSGHSEIFGAGELGTIPNRIQGLERWERHVGSGRHYPQCVDDLTEYVTKGIANEVLEELREYDPKAKHIVDKLPHNFESIGLIKFLFPKAKIISVRRDPRDIALSNYFTDYQAKYGGMGFAYDLTEIGEQLADHNLLMHHWHQVFPGEILEINYEDVVDDLQGSARKLLAYIGVKWEDQVLNFNELDRPVKTASVWQVRQPIYKTSKAKWMHYQDYLAPLIQGTNAPIRPEPITDMITLPEPGFLTDGVALFKKGDLDGAEYSFKKMLHHNPNHAACQYMVGLVYLNKNHLLEGIEWIEKALKTCPWQKEWRDNLIKAYEVTDQAEKAEALRQKAGLSSETAPQAPEIDDDALLLATDTAVLNYNP